jgi:thiazole synthase
MSDSLILAGREFRSRLIVGTGKYPTLQVMREAHEASGADMVTVAVRRVDLKARGPENLLDHIDTKRIFILPNTAGCYNADEAVRTARLGREAGLSHWVKLEVIGDEKTLFPDTEGLLVGHAHPGQGRLHRPALHLRRRRGGEEARRTRGRPR